jgi:hypothetical protein
MSFDRTPVHLLLFLALFLVGQALTGTAVAKGKAIALGPEAGSGFTESLVDDVDGAPAAADEGAYRSIAAGGRREDGPALDFSSWSDFALRATGPPADATMYVRRSSRF